MKADKLFQCSGQSARWAPLWAYVATTVVIVFAQIESDADGWLRLVIAAAAVAANVAIITAIHRKWRYAWSHR